MENDWTIHAREAIALFNKGAIHEARDKIDTALSKNPSHPNLLRLGNTIHRATGDRETALQLSTKLIAELPADSDSYQRVAHDLAALKRYSEAARLLGQAQSAVNDPQTIRTTSRDLFFAIRRQEGLSKAGLFASSLISSGLTDWEVCLTVSQDLMQQSNTGTSATRPDSSEATRTALSHHMGIISRFEDFNTTFTFYVNNTRDVIQQHHLNGQLYETEELGIIRDFSRDHWRFLDIGANVGNHAIFMAKVLKANEVIAFEANPDTATLLDFNIRLNSVGEIVNLSHLGRGLGRTVEEIQMHVPADNIGAARRCPSGIKGSQHRIRVLPLDSLQLPGLFDFIKIDVEGMEMEVLDGMQELIRQSRPRIFIEVDNHNQQAFQAWCQATKYTITKEFKRYPQNTNYLLLAG